MRCQTARCCCGELMPQRAISSSVRKQPWHSSTSLFMMHTDTQGDCKASLSGTRCTCCQRWRRLCQGVCGSVISVHRQTQQQRAFGHLVTGCIQQFGYRAVAGCGHRMFHLHGFHHSECLTGHHFVAGLHCK